MIGPTGSTQSVRARRGFTLVEAMIVLAIVALLAAIAYPSWAEQVRKGYRAQARAALADLLLQQERYFTQKGSYRAFDADTPAATVPFKRYAGDSPIDPLYRLTAAACPGTVIAQCVELTAIPRPGLDPVMAKLTLDSTGRRGCHGGTVTEASRCWQ